MKILLLEDDLVLTTELKKFLDTYAAVCDNVYDGEQFLEKAQTMVYDIYLLDIHVPKLNGLQVCEAIRKSDKTTPIIVISAFGDLSDKRKAFESFADDFLVKPFQLDELLLRINSLLRRKFRDEEVSELISVGDLVINKSEQTVSRAGREIVLTLKEFQLLLFLASAGGRTVSKQQITESVWEQNFSTNTNTVEVYINFLRKKIDKNFTTKLIHTRPGFGYYLSAL